MRIAVVGAGAVGSLLGALLAREAMDGQAGQAMQAGQAVDGRLSPGHLVVLIDRGARLEDLRNGSELVVESNYVGTFTVDITPEPEPGKVVVCGSTAKAARLLKGPAEVVLLCVKSFHTPGALRDLEQARTPPLVGPETLLVSSQNGVDNEPAIARALGWERTVGGVAIVAASIDGAGTIRCDRPPKVDLGLFGPEGTPAVSLAPEWAQTRLKELVVALDAAGVRTRSVPDIQARLWRKLVSNAAMNPLTAVTGHTLDEVAIRPALMELVATAMQEAAAVGRAEGHKIPDKVIELSLAAMPGMVGFAPSMLQDMRAGRPLELEGLVGAVTRRGRDHGLATPVLDTLEALLAGMTDISVGQGWDGNRPSDDPVPSDRSERTERAEHLNAGR